jgi:hypothetical protein
MNDFLSDPCLEKCSQYDREPNRSRIKTGAQPSPQNKNKERSVKKET